MKAHPRERGAAILLALILVMVMSIGVSAVWKYLHATLSEQKRIENIEAAFHLAEAGLEKAVAELRVRPAAYQGETDTPLGAGRFSVAVRSSGNGCYEMVASGVMGEGRVVRAKRTLRAELALSPSGEMLSYHWEVEKK